MTPGELFTPDIQITRLSWGRWMAQHSPELCGRSHQQILQWFEVIRIFIHGWRSQTKYPGIGPAGPTPLARPLLFPSLKKYCKKKQTFSVIQSSGTYTYSCIPSLTSSEIQNPLLLTQKAVRGHVPALSTQPALRSNPSNGPSLWS